MADRSILFVVWGEKHVDGVRRCVEESRLPDYPIHLVTDRETDTSSLPPAISVTRRDFSLRWTRRKLEVYTSLPPDVGTVMVVDSDVRVLADISLPFEKAERHGIAMAPAPHYSLPNFRDFGEFMLRKGIAPRSELVYNAGIVWLDSRRDDVLEVFRLAERLAQEPDREDKAWGDQPFITFAMELLGFNPYTLSPSYNYRGFGELASGSIRIWHSRHPAPPDTPVLHPRYLHRYEDGAWVRVRPVRGSAHPEGHKH
jgi:hypothetical protein